MQRDTNEGERDMTDSPTVGKSKGSERAQLGPTGMILKMDNLAIIYFRYSGNGGMHICIKASVENT